MVVCFAVVFLFGVTIRPAYAAEGFFQTLWCSLISVVGITCDTEVEDTIADTTVTVGDYISQPTETQQEPVRTASSTTQIVRETPTYVTNEYITNPTTIIRETIRESGGGGGSSVNTDDFVSRTLFSLQTNSIYDSVSDSIGGLSDSLADSVSTGLLTVTGNMSASGSVTLSSLGGGVLITNSSGAVSTTTLGAAYITDNSLDFNKLSDTLTVDALTSFDLDTNGADLNFDSGTFFIDSSANRIGIGTTSPTSALSLTADGIAVHPSVTYTVCSASARGKDACDYVADGTADEVQINTALTAAGNAGDGTVVLSEGTFTLSAGLSIPQNVSLRGNGWGTVVNIAGVPQGISVTMNDYTSLSDIKFVGSISPVRTERWEILAGNHSYIDHVWIDSNPYGIQTTGKTNVYITNFKASNIRGSNGWAAAIHGAAGADQIHIKNVEITNSDRGIEFEDGAKNVYASNGSLINVYPTSGAQTYTFTLDAHTHSSDSTSPTQNITYENFYLENSGGPTAISVGETYITENITFRNITINNVWSPGGGAYGTMAASSSRNVVFENINVYGTSSISNIGVRGVENIKFIGLELRDSVYHNLIVYGSENILIQNSDITSSGTNTYSLNIVGTSTNLVIENNNFNDISQLGGLRVLAGEGVTIKNNKFSMHASSPGDYGVIAAGNNVRILNNTFSGTPDLYAIYIATSSDSGVISGNYLANKSILLASSANNFNVFENTTTNGSVVNNGTGNRFYNNKNISSDIFNISTSSIGIGTTNPNYLLTLANASATTTLAILGSLNAIDSAIYLGEDDDAGGGFKYIANGNRLSVYTTASGMDSGAERMTFLRDSGNVGIGTISPNYLLTVANTSATATLAIIGSSNAIDSALFVGEDANSGGGFRYIANGNRLSVFTSSSGATAGSERMTVLRDSGNVGIATTSPAYTLSVAGTVGFSGLTGSSGAGSLCLSSAGQVVYNSGSDNCMSSVRATKHDITELAFGSSTEEMLKQLKPTSFIYNYDDTNRVRYGFIADEAFVIDEHLVTYNADGEISGLDTNGFIALIVSAVKDIYTKIAGFAESFTTKHFTTEEFCIGDTCIDEVKFKALLEDSDIEASVQETLLDEDNDTSSHVASSTSSDFNSNENQIASSTATSTEDEPDVDQVETTNDTVEEAEIDEESAEDSLPGGDNDDEVIDTDLNSSDSQSEPLDDPVI